MYKGVNAGVFLRNNLSSLTCRWLSRVLQSLARELTQISPSPDYICSHLPRTRQVVARRCLANARHPNMYGFGQKYFSKSFTRQ